MGLIQIATIRECKLRIQLEMEAKDQATVKKRMMYTYIAVTILLIVSIGMTIFITIISNQ